MAKVLRAYLTKRPDIRLVRVADCVEDLLAEPDEGLVSQVCCCPTLACPASSAPETPAQLFSQHLRRII